MNTTLKQTFLDISKIIERESKSSSYKFALLKATIDIIQSCNPNIELKESHAILPIGYFVEKWIYYYFPLLSDKFLIPQINTKAKLAFQIQLQEFISYYDKVGGLPAFHKAIKTNTLPEQLTASFYSLVKIIYQTIIQNPMKYIGTSIYNGSKYGIFEPQHDANFKKVKQTTVERLGNSFNHMGTVKIPLQFYEAFYILGSFISGSESILSRWTDFSYEMSNRVITKEKIYSCLIQNPTLERDVALSKQLFDSWPNSNNESLRCVWTNRELKSFEIDHIIPYSVYFNNDLWNLLPALPEVNRKKRDKIPDTNLILERKEVIIKYWEYLISKQPVLFYREFEVNLSGFTPGQNEPKTKLPLGFEKLLNLSNYLINTRGYEPWQGI